MSEFETAARLFREVGPLLEPDAVLEFAETKSWAVMLPSGMAVTATFDADAASLFFEVPLGPVPEAGRATAHEFLLRMSSLWRDTGGVHGAIAGDDQATLIHHRPLSGLDAGRLRILLINLGRYAEGWATVVGAADDADPSEDTDPQSPALTGIRV